MEIRRLELEHLKNTRDLGGFPAAGGRTIRSGRLLRSGQLQNADAREQQLLTGRCGVRRVVDFRCGLECSESPDPEMPGVRQVQAPILSAATMGITHEEGSEEKGIELFLHNMDRSSESGAQYMQRLYANVVRAPEARQGYRDFFACLLEAEEGATLWHCSAGKDRAGIGTVLLLNVLGVPQQLILQDYLATRGFLADVNAAMCREIWEKTRRQDAVDYLMAMRDVSPDYLDAALGAMREDWGSVEGYLGGALGIGAAETERLRALYLE